MADLDPRNARTTIERAIVSALSLAYRVRGPVAADIAAVRAIVSAALIDKSLRYVTSKAVCYQWSRYSIASDDGDAALKPTDISGGNPGRWLKTSSTVTSGYAKEVKLYNGEGSSEQLLTQLLGLKPSFTVLWTGSENQLKSYRHGVLYRYIPSFQIWAVSTNLRHEQEVLEGSGVAVELTADPGVISMIGDAKLILGGSDLGVIGVSQVEIGAESQIAEDLSQRTFVNALDIKVFSTIQWPESGTVLVSSLRTTYKIAGIPAGSAGTIGIDNYLVSGYGIPLGSGLTKTPATGSAYVGAVLVSSSPVAHTFGGGVDTYRDLKADGTFIYTEVAQFSAPPTLANGQLRIGMTRTDSGSVLSDSILCTSLVTVMGPDTIPSSAATISALAVTPSSSSLATGQTLQMAAIVTYGDGTTEDVSARSDWTSSNVIAAIIGDDGLVYAVSAGAASITATFGGATSNAAALTIT